LTYHLKFDIIIEEVWLAFGRIREQQQYLTIHIQSGVRKWQTKEKVLFCGSLVTLLRLSMQAIIRKTKHKEVFGLGSENGVEIGGTTSKRAAGIDGRISKNGFQPAQDQSCRSCGRD
jgi:hypothetical protein